MQIPTLKHQKLVIALINHFVDKLGFTILNAAYNGYNHPRAHGRHEPDILARDKSGLLHIAEAKVGDDVYTQESKEQFLDFSNRIMSANTGQLSNVSVPFHIIVYKDDESKLLTVLNQLGLGTKVGSRIKIWTL